MGLQESRQTNRRRVSRSPPSVGVEGVAHRSQPIPRAAVDAALDTFALVMRERHPGMVAIPLRDVGADGTVLASGAGQVVRPFAARASGRPVLDWNASVTPLDYRRAGRASENVPAADDR